MSVFVFFRLSFSAGKKILDLFEEGWKMWRYFRVMFERRITNQPTSLASESDLNELFCV